MAKSPGDPLHIEARIWNSMVDAAWEYESRQRLSSPIGVNPALAHGQTIKVRNDSGSNLVGGSVLETGDAIIDTLEAHYLWFEGDQPAADGKPYGVLRRAVQSGDIDDMQVTGAVLARVDVQSVSDTHCSVAEGQTVFVSDSGGPVPILGPTPTSTGEQTLAVLLGQTAQRRMYVAYVGGTAITARSGTTAGSGTVTLKKLNGTTIEDYDDSSETAITKTVYNWVGSASGTNTYVIVEQDSFGTWWLVGEDCS